MSGFFSRFFACFSRKRLRFEDLSGKKVDDYTYNRIKNEQTEKALALIEKGRKTGFDKLSKDEKAFLEAYSKSGFAQ